MLDFLILGVCAYLIFRIVHRVFFNIEQLFAKETQPPSQTVPSQEKTSIPQQYNPYVPPPKIDPSPPVAPSAQKNKYAASRNSNKSAPPEKEAKDNEAYSLNSEK